MITFKEWLVLRESTGQHNRLSLSKIRGEKTLKLPMRIDKPDLMMNKK